VTATPGAVVVMGVSGAGKSEIGSAVAQRLGRPFIDADDFHPAANKEGWPQATSSTTPTGCRGWMP